MNVPQGRVLISGAGGFVGACLVRRFLEEGRQVHCLLRGTGTPWRLAGLEGRYTPHLADLRDAAAVRAAFRASRPDLVFHLAAHGTHHSQRDRAAILATNLLGTAHVLEAAAEVGYQALVHSGSSSEYGHKAAPMHSSDALEPRTDYAVAKAAATLLCQAEAQRGKPVTTVRLFTAYGPWDDPARLIPSVMHTCRRGEPPLVTHGDQPRDFIYIDDVLDLLVLATRCPRARGRILHAGSGRSHTVRALVEVIVQVCVRGTLRPLFGAVPARPDEPRCWVADIEETTTLTGWQPRVGLHRGIEQTWRWLMAQPQAGRTSSLSA